MGVLPGDLVSLTPALTGHAPGKQSEEEDISKSLKEDISKSHLHDVSAET